MLRYFLVPIVTVTAPDGTTERRPKGMDGLSWSAIYPDDGVKSFTLVAVRASEPEDFNALLADSEIEAVPYVPDWSALLSTQFTTRSLDNFLKNLNQKRGIPVSGITINNTFDDLLMACAAFLRPGIKSKDYRIKV